MRKIILIAVMAIISVSASAELDFGIKASYISSIGFSNLEDVKGYSWNQAKSEFSNGFNAGLFARIGLGEGSFYIQPEVLYNLEKKEFSLMKELTDGTEFGINKVVSARTIDIPLLVGLKLLDLKVVNFRLLAGPKFRFNAGSKFDFDAADGYQDEVKDVVENFRSATVGLDAGVEVEVLNKVSLGVRYNLIKEMSKGTDWENNNTSDYNDPLNGFIVSLGLKIF